MVKPKALRVHWNIGHGAFTKTRCGVDGTKISTEPAHVTCDRCRELMPVSSDNENPSTLHDLILQDLRILTREGRGFAGRGDLPGAYERCLEQAMLLRRLLRDRTRVLMPSITTEQVESLGEKL